MKKLLAVLFILSVLVSFPLNSKAQTTIDTAKPVTVGFDDTFAPFGFKDEKGDYVGFDIELAKAVFEKMNVEYNFQPIDWSTKETELNSGKIDLIWNGYTKTAEREAVVQFSDTYMDNRQIIVVKADSDIKTKKDLADKMVVTQSESSALDAILKEASLVATFNGGEPITYGSFVEVFADLDNGRADAIVVDERLATYFLSNKDNSTDYRILEENFGEEEYAVGFRKDDQAFVEEFNKALAAVIKEGKFDEIKAKWFAEIE